MILVISTRGMIITRAQFLDTRLFPPPPQLDIWGFPSSTHLEQIISTPREAVKFTTDCFANALAALAAQTGDVDVPA